MTFVGGARADSPTHGSQKDEGGGSVLHCEAKALRPLPASFTWRLEQLADVFCRGAGFQVNEPCVAALRAEHGENRLAAR